MPGPVYLLATGFLPKSLKIKVLVSFLEQDVVHDAFSELLEWLCYMRTVFPHYLS